MIMGKIKISILCEDQAKMGFKDKIFLAQHGFSVFIEAQKKILFDVGPSSVIIHNAKLLGINLDEAEAIVLSHGHWDHSNGLKSLQKVFRGRKDLFIHPEAFINRRRPTGEFNGISMTPNEITKKYNLKCVKTPYPITENIFYLGEIPRKNYFEAKETSFYYIRNHRKYPDFILDDTALTINTKRGLIIIVGCSHAGICNIVEYAKEITRKEKILMVLGGFHLLGNLLQLKNTINFFKKNPVKYLYPMHCTDLTSLAKFYEVFRITKLCTGDCIEIDQ